MPSLGHRRDSSSMSSFSGCVLGFPVHGICHSFAGDSEDPALDMTGILQAPARILEHIWIVSQGLVCTSGHVRANVMSNYRMHDK
jgi:hypothetical protein